MKYTPHIISSEIPTPSVPLKCMLLKLCFGSISHALILLSLECLAISQLTSHGHVVLCQNNEHCFDNKWSENVSQYEEEEKVDIEP